MVQIIYDQVVTKIVKVLLQLGASATRPASHPHEGCLRPPLSINRQPSCRGLLISVKTSRDSLVAIVVACALQINMADISTPNSFAPSTPLQDDDASPTDIRPRSGKPAEVPEPSQDAARLDGEAKVQVDKILQSDVCGEGR